MRRLPFFAFLLLIAINGADAQELARVEACLAAKADNNKATPNFSECVGITLDDCMDRPGGATTLGIVECHKAETAAWDVLLNRYYKQAQIGLSAELITSLRDVQRSWITFRDLSCRFAYDWAGGGTIRGPLAADCLLRKTAEQALWLKVWAEER